MKIIGQQTWDFLTRFKADVYLDNITESTQTHVVGIGTDGKLYKQEGGDITGVSITTDSGGGSKAEDTSGSADFSILGATGVGVTNSGTTITATAVPGEIDHDSLSNFVAAEHYRWDTDIASTATIHTENITDLHGAGVDGAANQLLTDDGDGSVTSEAGLTFQQPGFGFSWLGFPSITNSNDYLRIQVGDHGASRINTVDADGIEANLNIDAGGELELQSTGQMTLDSSSSIELNADGGTISFKDGETTLGTITSSGWSGTSAKTIVTDSTANTDFPVVFNDESNGLLDDTGAFKYNPSTATLYATNLVVSGTQTIQNETIAVVSDNTIAFEGTSADAHEILLTADNATGSDKTITLPNITGTAAVLDSTASGYIAGTLAPSAGVYTAVTTLDMATVYGLNSTAVSITPTPHVSQQIMLTDCWAYVTTPNYPSSGVANTANWAFQIGKTTGAGTYNKAKGIEGLLNRLAYNQSANTTKVHRISLFPNGSSNYGLPEPGLPLLVWTSIDPTGSASTGSESIISIKLVTQYTVIPS